MNATVILQAILGSALLASGSWLWLRSIPTPGESVRVSFSERSAKRLDEHGLKLVFLLIGAGIFLIAHAFSG